MLGVKLELKGIQIIKQVQYEKLSSNMLYISRPRIVAEVHPMRPSYSDVLSKSIITSPKTNKNCQNVKQKATDVKIKSPKSVIGRTLSGNGNILNRQHSAGLFFNLI